MCVLERGVHLCIGKGCGEGSEDSAVWSELRISRQIVTQSGASQAAC